MEDYARMELSTQIAIKEALKRDIQFNIPDQNDNFIRLRVFSEGGRL